MKIKGRVIKNEFIPENIEKYQDALAKLDGAGLIEIDIPTLREYRTNKQNDSLHLYFKEVADHLNAHGYSLQKTVKVDVDMWWTGRMVKEIIWKTYQRVVLGKESTKELYTDEIDKIVERMDHMLSERQLDPIEFPSYYREMFKKR